MNHTDAAMAFNSPRSGFTLTGTSGGNFARSVFAAILFFFVLDTLFDPADLLFGLKLPLYALCWCSGLISCMAGREKVTVSRKLVIYSLLMISIPLLSILSYHLVDGNERYEGFQLLKAYLFISMAVLLYLTQTNLLKSLSLALTLIALSIFAVTALVFVVPSLYIPAYVFGEQYRIFSIDSRDYGSGLVMFQMYFVTSSMLTISAAYYFGLAYRSAHKRGLHCALVVLHTGAMILAGTRNNIIVAVLLPIVLTFMYSKRKGLIAGIIAVGFLISLIVFREQVGILLSPVEASNQTKLDMLGDYAAIFDSQLNLWLGRGLGAYEKWSGRGSNFVTELTYLEIIRNYGLLMGLIIVLLLTYPIAYAFVFRKSYPDKHIVVAYAMYLIMSATNPLLFSSTGMLILSVIIANIFRHSSVTARGALATS
jgi:hypothetical protein